MKKQIIAAILATFTYSSNSKAELTDSHYVFLESMSQIVYDNVPCEETEEAMNNRLRKYLNQRFRIAFNAQLKLLGVSKADQRIAFSYYDELIEQYAQDCANGDPEDDEMGEDEEF